MNQRPKLRTIDIDADPIDNLNQSMYEIPSKNMATEGPNGKQNEL